MRSIIELITCCVKTLGKKQTMVDLQYKTDHRSRKSFFYKDSFVLKTRLAGKVGILKHWFSKNGSAVQVERSEKQ